MLFLIDFAPLVLFLAGYLYKEIFFAILSNLSHRTNIIKIIESWNITCL